MTKAKKTVCLLFAIVMILQGLLTGCNDTNKTNEKDYFKMETSIAYSSGDTKNWTYGNQRKEFPDDDSCYVRIGVKAITSGFLGRGSDTEVEVTYRFTGTKDCAVEVSDGKATKVDTGDINVTAFTHAVTTAKESNANEDVMIFRYSPSGADSVILEVIYDDQVAEKYDVYNTVYFTKTNSAPNGAH